MPITHLPRAASPDEVAAAVGRDGAAVVDEVVSADLLDRIAAELRPFLDATPTGPDDFSGNRTRRTGSLIARSPSCRELVMHPLALGTARTFLGHATNIQLHLTQAIAIGPGETPQPLHRDQWAFDLFPFPAGYEVQCNTIWALTEFTDENGATRVAPGSNRQEDKVSINPDDTEPAAMARGSVLFYSGSVYHGGGANRSDATRIGLNITYNLAWLRQEENQYLSVPREVAETLPTDLLRVMGYDRGAYALGYIDDLRDPIEAVRPGIGTTGFGVHAERLRPAGTPSAICGSTREHHYRGAVPVEIREAVVDDYDELYTAFSQIVHAGEGFPQRPPLTREDFDDYWIHSAAVSVARFGGYLIGASYIKPNYVGRAAHIANAGYFVLAPYRSTGVGRSLVEHSLREARRLGFDAMMFNLVFESNPARAMYTQLGFDEVGRIPHAVEGEDAVIYWRSLEDIEP